MKNRKYTTEIAKYFRDFLETNFHKRKAPKRSFHTKNEKNLLTGIPLKPYENIKKALNKSILNSMKDSILIEKGKCTQGLSASIIDFVRKYYLSLKADLYTSFSRDAENEAQRIISDNSKNTEQAKEKILSFVKTKISALYLDPFFELISPLLKEAHPYDDDALFSMQTELITIIEEKYLPYISDFVIENLVEKSNHPLSIGEKLPFESLTAEINCYFRALKTEDLFFKVNELVNNGELIDKQQLYLYIFDIRFGSSTYPLLYVPVEISKTPNAITIVPDSAVYINKKAIDFVVENYNLSNEKQGKIKSAEDRIIYLQEEQQNLGALIEKLANELLNYLEMDGTFSLSGAGIQNFKSGEITITNNCYLALFDKSDEALVNDYEELITILNSAGALGQNFYELLEGFLKSDPIKIVSNVEAEWDKTDVSEKLVNISPIPLNEEQNQILSALRKDDCKYITVEGPPGTGKSHTITAIVFSMILDKKNVLVLSDKKEALDVVEDKITDTLNKVRFSDDFQNPILRLGKAGNTYSKILSSESLHDIKNHFKAVSKKKFGLDNQITNITAILKNNITTEINQYSGIDLSSIALLQRYETYFESKNLNFVSDEEWSNKSQIADDIESLYEIALDLGFLLGDLQQELIASYSTVVEGGITIQGLRAYHQLLIAIQNLKSYPKGFSSIKKFGSLNKLNYAKLQSVAFRTRDLGKGFFGFFLKGKQLDTLLNELQTTIDCPGIVNLRSDLPTLLDAIDLIEAFEDKLSTSSIGKFPFKSDLYTYLPKLAALDLATEILKVEDLTKDLEEINEFILEYPKTAKSINLNSALDILTCKLVAIDEADVSQLIEYLKLKGKIESSFNGIPTYDYSQGKNAIQSLYTTKMTHILDERVVNFSEQYGAKAKTLKKIISSKKRFPKDEFEYLKEAFPCIIAGIRDYAEFIPLDPNMFDLVIIDEASQVSIAQALPAILRGKKVIVFGDKRQFSNIKSAQAKSLVNQQYLQNVKASYLEEHSNNESELERLSRFNIKTSVLDFFEYICNYNIMLRKHFRGYRELISYSSKYFYQDHLQAIKIRGKKIDETLEFRFVSHDGKLDPIENTNILEIDEIINYVDHVTANNELTIGIITPHTNQQQLLFEKISAHPRYEDFQKKNRIKIMTFDTCQGEERDFIIYSMVANPASDKLGYIFIKNLNEIDFDEENKIKAQRLNVGFSRAKEKMVFILSKPIDEFTGTIKDALKHFENTLIRSRKLPSEQDVDPSSPMEKKVLNWIQETKFFKENFASIELKAQFPIGEYLKQLEPTYKHPKYVCDFLLLFQDDNKNYHKVIIEYDGFKEHFTNLSEVSATNFGSYYTEDHVFREKVLEGYGYRFLRINRFNVGKDPIAKLDYRLQIIMRNSMSNTNPSLVKDIQSIANEIKEGSLKECSKCNSLKPISEFEDKALISGQGRVCRQCKAKPAIRKRHRPTSQVPKDIAQINAVSIGGKACCPKCSSPMTLRNGQYGRFLGCTKFPRCKGTRQIA